MRSHTDHPPGEREKWVDDLADKIEIQRFCSTQVLVPAASVPGDVTGNLTTEFARDWRLKKNWRRLECLQTKDEEITLCGEEIC